MTKWNEQFKNHQVINDWEKLLQTIESKELENRINEESIEDISRIKKVLIYLDGIFKNFDPDLIPINTLTNIQKSTVNCTNELNGFIGNANIGHLTNANNHIDQLLHIFSQTHAAFFGGTKRNIKSSIDAYSEVTDKYTSKLKNKFTSEIEKIGSLSNEYESELQKQGKLLENLNSQISVVKQTIEKQTSEFNTQFQNSEKERKDRNEKIIEKLNSDVSETIKLFEQQVDDNFKTLSLKSSKIIEVLVKLQDDAEKVYGVTINTLQAGAYSSYANSERKIANKYRIYASLLMLLGAIFLVAPEVKPLFTDEEYQFDALKILARAALSLVIFVPAFYFARESNGHRKNEITNRRRQHILTTLDPYIELMDPSKGEDLKTHVAKTIFSEDSTANSTYEKETGNLLSQLSNLVKQLKN